MNGGDSTYVALLPFGFAIVPDGPKIDNTGQKACGSLLTVAFQILVNSQPVAKLTVESVQTLNNLILCTIKKINNALLSMSISFGQKSGDSVLTMAFQILVNSQLVAKLTLEYVETMNNHISCTNKKIKNALQCNTRVPYWASYIYFFFAKWSSCFLTFSLKAMSANQSSMLILQETCTDASGSMVVYAPVDIPTMQLALNGGDSTYVALLPFGFAILPNGPSIDNSGQNSGDSLLTMVFQILINRNLVAKLTVESVKTVNNLISCTIKKIKNALLCNTLVPYWVSLLAMSANQSSMLILQETCTDVSGNMVVYALVDISTMQLVMNGGDSTYVALLPCGFPILPDGPSIDNIGQKSGDSLLTMAF
ncbi:hypothetical protein EJB05_00904, partial [Eragrostis curvula]